MSIVGSIELFVLPLSRSLARVFPAAPNSELEDAIQFAIERLLSVSDQDAIQNPTAWLYTVAARYLHKSDARRRDVAAITEIHPEPAVEVKYCEDQTEYALRSMYPSEVSYSIMRYLFDREPQNFILAHTHFEHGWTLEHIARSHGGIETADSLQKRLSRALQRAAHACGFETHLDKKRGRSKMARERERETGLHEQEFIISRVGFTGTFRTMI